MSGTPMNLPTDSAVRKNRPMAAGLLDYFPAALAEVAYVSYVGNEKHNPGEPLHHARGKSMDHADCIVRHLADRGAIDTVQLPDGRLFRVRHTAYVAWRALALLQEELEADGAPLARGAKLPPSGPVDERSNGWTPWHGESARPPVDEDVAVAVRFHCGTESEKHNAGSWSWRWEGKLPGKYDIVAWKRV